MPLEEAVHSITSGRRGQACGLIQVTFIMGAVIHNPVIIFGQMKS